MNWVIGCLTLALLASGQSATACRGWSPAPLPMESAADYDSRTAEAERQHLLLMRYTRELQNVNEARRIYLARISEKTDYFRARNYSEPYANHVTVQPITAIRGQLPSSERKLVNNYPHSCVIDGNGEAASGELGDYVFVFEGVRTHGYDGADSIIAKNAHSELLTKALTDYVTKADGGPFRVDEQGNTLERQPDGSFKLPEISDPFPK
jgi:hypothetical protein